MESRERVLRAVGGGFIVAGRAVGRAAVAAGRAVASAYHAVDPDLRRHVAQLPLAGLSVLVPRAAVAALPDDGHRPVVFVHGLGGDSGNFLPMQTFFRWNGRTRTYALGLPPGPSLEALAEALADALAAVIEANALPPDATLDVVAHSMGGIVSRLALDDPRLAGRVRTLVTLGTPHAGTYLARLAGASPVRDLRPDGAAFEHLRAQLPWTPGPARPRLVSFWSASDLLLMPPTTACVEGAENVELPGFTHYGFLLHPKAWTHVLEALG